MGAMTNLALRPIGVVEGGRDEAYEDGWGRVDARIVLDPDVVGLDATVALEDFSHLDAPC
jgi:tRNA (adenine37-N6)-methyltransferase